MPKELEIFIPTLQVLFFLIGGYFVALWLALIVWTFRDVQKRSNDIFVQAFATLLVLLFNLPGLFLYLILRPPESLAEGYARSLEEESLMQDIEERQACPQCKHRIQPDYLICPACRIQLKRLCPSCQRLLHLGWQACPYCGQG